MVDIRYLRRENMSMDYCPRDNVDADLEFDAIPDELADEYAGFLEYIESDMFSEWLIEAIGNRKVHIRKIVSMLIFDCYFSPKPSGAAQLPQELFVRLSTRIYELEEEGLLKRERNGVDLIRLARKPPTHSAAEQHIAHADYITEPSPKRLEPLEQRIRAARLGVTAVRSSTPN